MWELFEWKQVFSIKLCAGFFSWCRCYGYMMRRLLQARDASKVLISRILCHYIRIYEIIPSLYFVLFFCCCFWFTLLSYLVWFPGKISYYYQFFFGWFIHSQTFATFPFFYTAYLKFSWSHVYACISLCCCYRMQFIFGSTSFKRNRKIKNRHSNMHWNKNSKYHQQQYIFRTRGASTTYNKIQTKKNRIQQRLNNRHLR